MASRRYFDESAVQVCKCGAAQFNIVQFRGLQCNYVQYNKLFMLHFTGVQCSAKFPALVSHMCSIQCTVGGDRVVENQHYKIDLTTSNYKTGAISVTGVVATSERSQNLQAGHTVILKY